MLNLEQIVFTVDTRQLDDASKKLLGLASDAQELTNNLSAMAAKNAAAQKKSADANLANAKATKLVADAELVNAKAKQAAANAAERMASATLKEAKAKDDATKATAAFSSTTEKQKAITDEMLRGFSKGEATIIAMAKSVGETTDEIERLLVIQRQLKGGDPFDKSLDSIRALQNEYKSLNIASNLVSQGFGLTKKEAIDLARSIQRLEIAGKESGKSMLQINSEVENLKKEFINTATASGKLSQFIEQNETSVRSTAKAMSFLERELARTDNVLEGFGNELNQVSSNRLMRFREELKKSGVDAVTAAAMLEKYENNLRRIGEVNQQKLAKNRKDELDYLARATSVQLGDIGISLAGGQNPLLVLIQQGDQLRGVLNQVGADAGEMRKAMSMAFSQIVMGAIDVSKALGGFVLGAFVDMGKGITRVVDNLTGVFSVLEMFRYQMTLMAYANKDTAGTFLFAAKAIGVLQTAALSLATAAATASVVAMLALVVATAQYVSENKKLVDALALSSGSLGITKDIAEGYILTLAGMGVTTGVATEAIVQMGKAGNLTKDEILMIGESAQQMQQWTSASVEDVVKQFSKLKEKPVEALTELAKRTGMIRPELIATVEELQKQGKYADAAAVAMKAYGQVTNQVASQAKQDYNELTRAVIDWSNEVSKGFSKFFKGLLYNVTPLEQVVEGLESVRNRLAKERSLMFKDDKLIAQLEMQERLLVGQLGTMRRQQYQQEQQSEAVARQIRLDEARKNAIEDINKSLDSLTKKELTLEERKAKAVNDYRKDIAKKLSINVDDVQVPDEVLAKLEKIAKIEHERDQRKEKQAVAKQDPIEKFYIQTLEKVNQQLAEAEGKTNQLTKAEMLLNQVRRDSRYGELTAAQQKEIELLAQKAEIAQRTNAADEIRNRLIGDATGLGKDYYETVEKINGLVNKPGGLGAEEATRLLKALGESTPLAKAMQEYYDKMQASIAKYNEEHRNGLATLAIERDDLDFRLSLLGKSANEQRRITIEYEKQKQSAQALLEYQRKIAEIDKDTALDLKGKEKAKDDALIRYQKRLENINYDAAVKYAEDFQREFDRISNGITDALVTALFEGGKSGSKKLRDVIVNELKKPVVLVVQAAVNILLGSIAGALGLGGGGIAGAAGGGIINSIVGSVIGRVGGSILGGGAAGAAGSFLGAGTLGGMFANLGSGFMTGISTLLSAGPGAAMSLGTGLMGAGSTGGGLGVLAGGVALPALAVLAVLNGLGLFRKTRKVGGGLMGTLGEGDINQYDLMRTSGTLFRGPKYRYVDKGKSQLSDDLQKQYKANRESIALMAESLGLDGKKVRNFTTTLGTDVIHPDTGGRGIKLDGLSEEQANAKIAEALATANNEIAMQVLGTWETTTRKVKKQVSETIGAGEDQMTVWHEVEETITETTYKASEFAKEGETAIETLTRLATSLSAVNITFDALGYTLLDASLAGGDFASKIIDQFGDIEKFTNATGVYFNNFYSEEEKLAAKRRQLDNEFKKMGLTLPKTREEYRKLVEAQDLTTEEGRKMFAFLINLSGMFADITASASDAAEADKQKRIDKATKAYEALEKAIQARISQLQKEADAAQLVVNRLRGIFDLLGKSIRELYMQVEPTANMLAAQGRDVIRTAISTGVVPEQEVLAQSIDAVRNEISTTSYATQFEADKARLEFAAELQALQNITGEQLSTAELTLKAIKDQIELLNLTLENARAQLDALNGINNSILSVDEALRQFLDAIKDPTGTGTTGGSSTPKPVFGPSGGGFVAGPGGTGGAPAQPKPGEKTADGKFNVETYLGSYGTIIRSATDEEQARLENLVPAFQQAWANATASGNIADFYRDMQSAGANLREVAALAGYWYEDVYRSAESAGVGFFANGGMHSGGARIVGEEAPELEVTGPARIYSARDTLDMLTGRDDAQAESMNKLASKVENLEYALQAIAINTGKSTRILERVTRDGESLLTTPAT